MNAPMVSVSVANALVAWLPRDGWQRLAADALWQSTALAAAGLVVAWMVRRRAALRAAVLLATVVLSVAVPVLSSVVRAANLGVLARATQLPIDVTQPAIPPVSESSPEKKMVQAIESSLADDLPSVDNEPDGVVESPPADVATPIAKVNSPLGGWIWLFAAWLAVSAVLALRLLRGWIALRRAIRLAEPCTDPAILAAMSRAAAALGVRQPAVFASETFETPALVALAQPRLLVPLEMPAGVDWFAVFCHEMAHLARRDGMSRLAIELCLVLLPWQPLLWIVRRRFRAACEEACDDWAVGYGADPVELASLLVALVPQPQPALALGMAESPAATRHRIMRLLATRRQVQPRLGKMVTALGWALAAVLAVVIAVLQFGRPAASDKQPSDTESATGVAATGFEHAPAAPPWGAQPLTEAIAAAAVTLEVNSGRPAPYVIQPPDILRVSVVKLVPRSPYRLEAEDTLDIAVANPLIDQAIMGNYVVDIDGEISMGPAYGSVKVLGLTLPEAREAIVEQLAHCLRNPQVQATLGAITSLPSISGERLVAPDGTINLGTYGIVYVAGRTIGQATEAIEGQLRKKLEHPQAAVDVFAYNSKIFYTVLQEADGDKLGRVPFTGGLTVLDALSRELNNRKLADPDDYWVWVARPADTSVPAVELASKRDVFATIDGVVTEVLVESGQEVKQGDALVRLSNKELEAAIADVTAQLAKAREKEKSAAGLPEYTPGGPNKPSVKYSDDPPAPEINGSEFELELRPESMQVDLTSEPLPEGYLQSRLDGLTKKHNRLTVVSPVDGRVSTRNLRELLLGRPVRQGQVLMDIVEPDGYDAALSATYTYTVPFQTYQFKPGTTVQPSTSHAAAPPSASPASGQPGSHDLILPVDWQAVVSGSDTTSNWQLKSGDRIFVRQKPKR